MGVSLYSGDFHLPSNRGHSKLLAMNYKPDFPMVTMTMAMRLYMEMFCCAKRKSR